MNIKNLKNKIVRNLPTIIGVTAVAAVVTTAAVLYVSVAREIKNAPSIDINEINKMLAEGTASMIQDADGTIHVFW